MAAKFGEMLKKRRTEKGMTQEQLASGSGLSVSTIRHLEQKDGDPTLSTLRAIAKALGLPVSDLLSDKK